MEEACLCFARGLVEKRLERVFRRAMAAQVTESYVLVLPPQSLRTSFESASFKGTKCGFINSDDLDVGIFRPLAGQRGAQPVEEDRIGAILL